MSRFCSQNFPLNIEIVNQLIGIFNNFKEFPTLRRQSFRNPRKTEHSIKSYTMLPCIVSSKFYLFVLMTSMDKRNEKREKSVEKKINFPYWTQFCRRLYTMLK